uniref:Torsin-1A-interacting protein 1/2 AAA+ activator domain-containing protein n=1 Tax=Hucho hucho TaxID=62062 RepID=A0A4W5Q9K0_9TELE
MELPGSEIEVNNTTDQVESSESHSTEKDAPAGQSTAGEGAAAGQSTTDEDAVEDAAAGRSPAGEDAAAGQSTAGENAAAGRSTAGEDAAAGLSTAGEGAAAGRSTAGEGAAAGRSTAGEGAAAGRSTAGEGAAAGRSTAGEGAVGEGAAAGRSTAGEGAAAGRSTAGERAVGERAAAGRSTAGYASKFMLAGFLMVLLAVAVRLFNPESPPENTAFNRTETFHRAMKKVEVAFPGQRSELWRRSRIHLERHLQTARPTEPVSLMLTAGRKGEKTLHCLALHLASAVSSALNASSILRIDGANMTGQDSDQVKLDIDTQLRRAFEGDQPVAVIDRFEELPPGSTIIFYRYCDHENAAYKEALLIFTVLLGGEEELPASLGLSAVEEMVDDHLQDKFLSSDQPAAFDMMDLDKFSGLWSRISHLVLPVAAEESIEQRGCV